jgi:hypothetical protein
MAGVLHARFLIWRYTGRSWISTLDTTYLFFWAYTSIEFYAIFLGTTGRTYNLAFLYMYTILNDIKA